jgi:hypothetical protein
MVGVNKMKKLTEEEIATLRKIINIELQMIKFLKGFGKEKGIYESNLDKILEKLK